MANMNEQPTTAKYTDDADKAQVLGMDELKQLAKFFDVLMEVDFELNRNAGAMSNAC